MIRAAVLTPRSAAGIATIGLAGQQLVALLEPLFVPFKSAASMMPHQAILGLLQDRQDTIDQVIVTLEPGLQHAEIHCHGGPRIIQCILTLLQARGVQIVSWQELRPSRTLAEEVAITLPYVLTPLGVLAIAAQNPGGLSQWAAQQRDALRAGTLNLKKLCVQTELLLQTYAQARALLNPATVVLVGAVNVGKSTLANALGGREQSIAADEPGTTRDWTGLPVDILGVPIHLIDTAGQRETHDPLEQEAIRRTEQWVRQADRVVLVTNPPPSPSQALRDFQRVFPGLPDPLVVVNKSDLISPSARIPEVLYISALFQEHLEGLRRALVARLGMAAFDPHQPLVFTARQYELLATLKPNLSQDVALAVLQRLLYDA